jgi:hypothetical protein
MYKVKRSQTTTKEEKAVAKITTIMSDFSLDLEAMGMYMAIGTPHIIYRRALEMLEAMEYNMQVTKYDKNQGSYDERIL